MPTLETIERDLKILRKQVSILIDKEPKQTWIGLSAVSDLTGWDNKEKLRWARNNGLVKYDREKGYLLESIPNVYIIKNKINA